MIIIALYQHCTVYRIKSTGSINNAANDPERAVDRNRGSDVDTRGKGTPSSFQVPTVPA